MFCILHTAKITQIFTRSVRNSPLQVHETRAPVQRPAKAGANLWPPPRPQTHGLITCSVGMHAPDCWENRAVPMFVVEKQYRCKNYTVDNIYDACCLRVQPVCKRLSVSLHSALHGRYIKQRISRTRSICRKIVYHVAGV